MTERQIQLVQHSWLQVKPVASQAGMIFYEKLFIEAPGIKHLFQHDLQGQADKLTRMLGYIVMRLNWLDDVITEIEELGKRHKAYGAAPEYYDVVGNCLVATLRDGLADKWNKELQDAWVAAFGIVKSAMLKHY